VAVRHGEGWCTVHGTWLAAGRDYDVVERPSPVRRRDLAARVGRRWSESEVRWVVANKDRMSATEMAGVLERSPRGVAIMLSKRKIRKRRVGELKQVAQPRGWYWTEQSRAALEDSAVLGALRRTAQRLQRSHAAVRWRLWRMGVRRADGYLSAREVAAQYGCTEHRVGRLIRLGVLPASKRGGSYWRIDPADAARLSRLLRARSKYTPKGLRR